MGNSANRFAALQRPAGLALLSFSAALLLGTAPLRAQQTEAQLPASVTLDPIQVEGAGAGQGIVGYVTRDSDASTKTDTPLIEVPQSISVVPADQIRDQGAHNVSEALRYTPSVLVQPNGESSHYDELRIRGFEPLKYQDGLPLPLLNWWATPRVETYGLQQIDVLRGPASALYGQNSPGGLVNMTSRRPSFTPIGEVQVQLGSYDRVQGAFDIGGPLNQDKTLAMRLTGLALGSDTQVDHTRDDRVFVAPSLSWRPTDNTTLTILTQYGEDRGTYPHQYLPAQGTVWGNPNGRISRHTYVGDNSFDDFRRSQYAVGYAFEHRFDDTWTVRQNLRYMGTTMELSALRSEGLQADMRTLNRNAASMSADATNIAVDNQGQANFRTGALEHKLLFGLDYARATGTYVFGFGTADPIDVYQPVYGRPNVGNIMLMSDQHQVQEQMGLYMQDQIRFDRWLLTLSGRQDWASMTTDDHLSDTRVKQNDSEFTYRAGLTYNFVNGIAPYVSYATSFQPVIGLGSDNQPFSPTTGEQFEAGIKYQPTGTNALFTVAAFDLRQKNSITYDPITFLGTQSGEVRVRGIELEARAALTERIELLASYSYLNSEVTESSNPYELGRNQPMTPEHQASAWLKYNFADSVIPGLSLGAGVRYQGASYSEVVSVDPIRVPSSTLFDAALYYDFGKAVSSLNGLRLAVNATNVFNRDTITYCYGEAYCSLGAGRTVTGTLSYRW